SAAADYDHPAAWAERLEQRFAEPVKRDPDVGVPVHGERLPGVILERAGKRARAGDEDQRVGVVAVEQTACDAGLGGVGDLRLHVGEVAGQLAERGCIARDSDDRGAVLGEGGGDSAAETAACADD